MNFAVNATRPRMVAARSSVTAITLVLNMGHRLDPRKGILRIEPFSGRESLVTGPTSFGTDRAADYGDSVRGTHGGAGYVRLDRATVFGGIAIRIIGLGGVAADFQNG